jgi:hypothetical protein
MLRVPLKYAAAMTIALVLFVYVMGTEAWERVSSIAAAYDECREVEASMLTPEQVRSERMSLLARESRLSRSGSGARPVRSPGDTGVLEYISLNASQAGLSLVQLLPQENEDKDGIREFRFSIRLEGGYHQLGRFLCAIETGVYPARMGELTVERSDRRGKLLISLKGSITLLEPLGKGD